jgi:hypothetical protein
MKRSLVRYGGASPLLIVVDGTTDGQLRVD